MGQIANCVAGLLILPVTRNSVWSLVFGVSWESIISFHQYMGWLLLLVIFMHMLLWWGVYVQQDTFPHDIFAVPMEYHSDNFTVPLAVIGFIVLLICMGALAQEWVRRANYELFYWAHHFAAVFFLIMLWHAVSTSLLLILIN
jgi:predicted ferric reductase